MTERVLGERKSKRRKGALLLPVLAAAALALFWISGAQAVHDAGLFELDTPSANAVTDGAQTNNLPDDWDEICKANPSTCTFKVGYTPPSSSAAALASSHVKDLSSTGAEVLNATIFQGNSKDPNGIGTWQWKDEAGGLPDKDNLLHAYAARYTRTASSTCPNGPGPTFTGNCSVIYFGSDRYDNSGDATQAFWFLQTPIGLGSTPTQGGFNFTGAHKNGDLLIISEFSNGGTTSTITVYKWTCAVAATCDTTGGVVFVAGGDNKSCAVVPTPGDPFCGIVNTATGLTTAPWTFLDKSGNTNFAQGELYEAGINLSDPSINLGNECFPSFVAETRSSTSTTATLKDFVVGSLQSCTANVSSVQDWLPNDSATVTIGGPTTWGGTLKFTLFDTLNCTGNKVYDPAGITISQATPMPVLTNNTSIKVTATANRSWEVDFTPDAATLALGVPDPAPVCESTALTVNNSATHG